ncbi:MAG TPA: MBL fold metallo-hydrolase [Gammaproteobacteria bacterium]|nr:MBL fold metallo-hydrolase [Gammaproteobacteria bacterium]
MVDMLFRQLFDTASSTFTYLIADRASGEALMIDPVLEQVENYDRLLAELDLKLVVTLETHTHADHVTAAGRLADTHGSKIVTGEHSRAQCVHERLRDGETLRLGDVAVDAIYTPGHTDDSYCYRVHDRVFTGDTLLIRGTGRTDFQNGDAFAAWDSLFNKLLRLPDETFVYPGHDYKGWTVSTIGEERAHNPRLQVGSAQEYADLMSKLNLPSPRLIDKAVPANLRCGRAAVSA